MVTVQHTDLRNFISLGQGPRVYIVVRLLSHFGGAFSVDLEMSHYRPGTPRNADFQVAMGIQYAGGRFSIFSIPRRDWSLAEKVAEKYGHKLSNIPTPAGDREGEGFPLTGPAVFMVEVDKDSPFYKAMVNTDPMELYLEEKRIIYAIYDKYGVPYPSNFESYDQLLAFIDGPATHQANRN